MVGAIVFQWMSFVWVITGWLTCEVDVLTLLVQCHRGCGEWIQRAHPLPPSPSYSSPPLLSLSGSYCFVVVSGRSSLLLTDRVHDLPRMLFITIVATASPQALSLLIPSFLYPWKQPQSELSRIISHVDTTLTVFSALLLSTQELMLIIALKVSPPLFRTTCWIRDDFDI